MSSRSSLFHALGFLAHEPGKPDQWFIELTRSSRRLGPYQSAAQALDQAKRLSVRVVKRVPALGAPR